MMKNAKFNELNDNTLDELYPTALEIVKSEGKASTSFLQRKLQIGYVEQLDYRYDGSKR